MKKISLAFFTLLISVVVFSQTVIEKPQIGCSTAQTLKVERITLSDSATVIDFHIKYQPGMWISIPKQTYIQPVGSEEKTFATGTEGIPFGEKYWMPETGEADYAVIFPKINPATHKIDYGEANAGGTWFIYDIHLKPAERMVPDFVSGNWYNQESGIWEVSFLDTVAIYDSKLWLYDEIDLSNDRGSVILAHKNQKVELFLKRDQHGLSIGKSLNEMTSCSHESNSHKINVDNEAYKAPLFNMDTAIYSGYIKGYSPRVGIETFTVIVNDIFSGGQNSNLVEINPDGSFFAKIPMYYPNNVFIHSNICRGSAFLEPGKSVFQMIDPMEEKQDRLFMGEGAGINVELSGFNEIYSFNFNDAREKILDMKPKQYAEYCKAFWLNDLSSLDSLLEIGQIGKKAWLVSKYNMDFIYAGNIMSYKWYFESAYRKKHNIPQNQRVLPIKVESPGVGCYDFITKEFVDDPLAILSQHYGMFINRLKYLDLFRPSVANNFISEAIGDLEKSGHHFTNSEQETITVINKLDSIMNSPENKSFREKYGNQEIGFYQKYKDAYSALKSKMQKTPVTVSMLGKELSDQGVILTDEELDLIAAYQAHENVPGIIIHNQLQTENQDSISALNKRYEEEIKAYSIKKMGDTRNKKLLEYFGIGKGFAIDIMALQDACRQIVNEMTPMTDQELENIKKKFTTPFIADYIAICNDQTKQKIEANKSKSGYTVNEVPKTAGDKLFDTMMEKFRGKVVYVDFWATWCGPCRSGIENIKPLKEEMANENVSFVYITNQTSPQNTWTNMITDIKGEHYRVSADEWNYLSSKFNITGIPHYVLVDKSGEVINPRLSHMNNSALKNLLKKHITE